VLCVVVGAPESVIVNVKFAVDEFVGAQRTLIVHVPPAATTWPNVQVPPGCTEAVPVPVPLVFTRLGGTVDENVRFDVMLLVTVTVPFLVLVPPVFSAGVGPENDTGVTPVPVSAAAPDDVKAGPATTRAPNLVPVVVGVNVTLTVQLAPAAKPVPPIGQTV